MKWNQGWLALKIVIEVKTVKLIGIVEGVNLLFSKLSDLKELFPLGENKETNYF